MFSSKKKAEAKYRNPEKFIVANRGQKNGKQRFERVKKKGLQSKKAKKTEVLTRVVGEIVNDTTDSVDDQPEAKQVSEHYHSNSLKSNYVFVIRIRGEAAVARDIKKALSSLRLRSENEGVLIRYTEGNRKLLDMVAPYVSYGQPSKKMVMELINRRGFGKVDGERVPLTGNSVIEDALGESTGVICVEDMVAEICEVGENFSEVVSFLWPFRLIAPKSGFQKRTLDYKDGGDYGDRGGLIDDLINQML